MQSSELADRLGVFREVLGCIAQGGPNAERAGEYRELRDGLLGDQRVGQLLPDFVNECRTSRDFWNYIQRAFSGHGAYSDRSRYIESQILPIERAFRPERQKAPGDRPPEIRIEYSPVRPATAGGLTLIADIRIAELRTLCSTQFDFQRLIRLCDELNTAYSHGCYLATIMLTRSLLDHVPPLFRKLNFTEVANNYGGGGRSFKETVQRLDAAARKIADAHLHTPIRRAETLPTAQQVNFAAELDLLLAEIVRLTR
jgi:hypothetical protein